MDKINQECSLFKKKYGSNKKYELSSKTRVRIPSAPQKDGLNNFSFFEWNIFVVKRVFLFIKWP